MKNNLNKQEKRKNEIIPLSIIIVNWNHKDLLKDCLDSIFKTHKENQFEIIVVDNHSADDSAAFIKEKYPEIVLIENHENLGFARANNQAIKIARGEYFLLLNNDTLIRNTHCFDRMLNYMEANREVGVLGCKLLYPDGTIQSEGESFPSVWKTFKTQILFVKTLQRITEGGLTNRTFKQVDYVCGACLMTRKTLFDEVGLLKEKYFMYGEDVEFCYRVKRTGNIIGVLVNENIIHLHSKSTEKNLTEMLYHSINNDLKNIQILYNSQLKVISVKILHLIGILIRAFLAIFRKGKNPMDYLRLFFRLLERKK